MSKPKNERTAPASDVLQISTPLVHTLSVTVQALRIGTKQVTQAVFRQLPQQTIWNPDTGELLGRPWGFVNYFWDECRQYEHKHIVWQRGETLYRACVYDPHAHVPRGLESARRYFRDCEQELDEATAFVCVVYALECGWNFTAREWGKFLKVRWTETLERAFDWRRIWKDSRKDWRDEGKESAGYYAYHTMHQQEKEPMAHRQRLTEYHDPCPEDQLPPASDDPWKLYGHEGWYRWIPETEEVWRQRYAEHMDTTLQYLRAAIARESASVWHMEETPTTAAEAIQVLQPYVQQYTATLQDLKKLDAVFMRSYAQLMTLPQLFIAV